MTAPTRDSAEVYTVVGGGAIGGTLAVHLAQNNVPVQIVDVDLAHVDAINSHGLHIRSAGSVLRAHIPAFTPTNGPEHLGAVLLAVKSHLTNTALDWTAPRLSERGYVVSMQNGINESTIAARLGEHRTVAAFVDLFADVVAPGVIEDGGAGMMALGEYAGGSSPRVQQLAEDLRHWGTPQISDNVDGFLWSKLAFGTMLAGTALRDEDMDTLIDQDRAMWTSLVREVISVADAEAITLESFDGFEPHHYRPETPEHEWSASMDRLVRWLAGQSKKRSGIWRDLAVRQQQTEVPYRYQQLIDIADKHHISLPGIQRLMTLIRELENQRTQMGPELLARLRTETTPPRKETQK